MESAIDRLNVLSSEEVKKRFLGCCGSTTWASRMTSERPFENAEALLRGAEDVWWSLEPADWLEAFRSHPKIGEQKAQASASAEAQTWSEQEQSTIADAGERTRAELADLNHAYEQKFGYIYIVCASGKSPEAMLAILKDRIDNAPAEELQLAAAEQAKITKLRLQKLLEP